MIIRMLVALTMGIFLAGSAAASMVDIGPAASGELPAQTILENAFGPGFVQVDNPGTFGDLSDFTPIVKQGGAAWSHEVGTYQADNGEYGLYVTSLSEGWGAYSETTFYTESSKNADDYDHFAVFYNEDGRYAWAIEDQDQRETDRAWLDHDHNDVVASVPIPGAVWLLGSGLIGLIGIRRRSGS